MNIYIVDDHPLVRHALAMTVLRLKPSAKVVELNGYNELAPAIKKNGLPALFILDLLLPGVKGTSAVTALSKLYPDVPLMVISSMPSSEAALPCLEAGANFYVEKTATPEKITHLLATLLEPSENANSRALVKDKILSKRQAQMLHMLDKGFSNRDIGLSLDISEHTVKVHLWRLFKKLDVNSRTQALCYARKNGWL